MKKVFLVCSHLYSGSSSLCELLSRNSVVQSFNYGVYNNVTNLIDLTSKKHKTNNRSAIYMDELLYNHQFSIKAAYKECNFLYFLGKPGVAIHLLVNSGVKPLYAVRYYTFRLRRLCEMAVRTPGAIFLTSDKLSDGLPLIQSYLGVKSPFVYDSSLFTEFEIGSVPVSFLKEADICYEKTCYFLKNHLLCLNK